MAPQKMIYVKEEDLPKLELAMGITKANLSNTVMQALDQFIDLSKGEKMDLQVLNIGGDLDIDFIINTYGHRQYNEFETIFDKYDEKLVKLYNTEKKVKFLSECNIKDIDYIDFGVEDEDDESIFSEHFNKCLQIAATQFKKENIAFYGKKVLDFTFINSDDIIESINDIVTKEPNEEMRRGAAINGLSSIELTKDFFEEATLEILGEKAVNKNYISNEAWSFPDLINYSLYQTSNDNYLLHMHINLEDLHKIRCDINVSVPNFSDYVIIKDIKNIEQEIKGEFTKAMFLLPNTLITKIKSAINQKTPYRLLDI